MIVNEPIFFLDILGIIGFQFYNLMYPPKRNNTNENNKNLIKEKFLDKMGNDYTKRKSDFVIITMISIDSNSEKK